MSRAGLALAALLLFAAAARPDGVFVAVGHHGTRLASDDGTTWRHLQTGKEGETYRAVAFGNGRFVAVGSYGGSNIFATTADGASWKTGTQDARYVNFLRGLAFHQDTFLGIGGDPGAVGDSRPFLMRSSDGLAWGAMEPIGGKHMIRRIAFGNGLAVGVGDRGRRAVSADGGRTWKDAPDTRAIDTLVDVAFGNGVFVGVGLHSLRLTSRDGLSWADRQTGAEGEHLNSVVWAAGRFVAVGPAAVLTSPDGKSWTRHALTDGPLFAIHGGGVFLGARWRGRILRSTDAIHWQQVHQCEHHVEAIAFGPR